MVWLYLLPMVVLLILLVLAIVAYLRLAISIERQRTRRIVAFFERPDALAGWQSQFPACSLSEIRDFLALFAESFSLSDKYQCLLRPDDRVIELYRAKYAPGVPDELELESLGLSLKKRYNLDLNSRWRDDVTLGTIFELTRS